jgi:hypothetical protein
MPDNLTPPARSIVEIEAQNRKQMEEVRKKEKEKEKAEEDQQFVIDGAILECKLCTNPVGMLKVNFDTPTMQNKKTATVKEKDSKSLIFMGTCTKSPNAAAPCVGVMQLGEWQDVGTSLVQDQKPLIKKSTIMCNYGGSTISIKKSGQINVPSTIDGKKKKVQTQVKEIELLTDLDDGSKNDGSGGLQKGYVFGKIYKFKVKSYTDGEPKTKSLIKWMYKYHNLTKNTWEEVYSEKTGENYSIHFNNKEMCGRFIYVRAYIENEDEEGELKIWKHNRFRYFDRSIIEEEIKERTDNKKPWLVNQAGTSLCGMACIFYLFAKEQPEAYKKFAKQLFRTGEAKHNKYTVKPSVELLEKKINKNRYPLNTGDMPLVDFVTMAGTRNTDNPKYKGGSEEFQAINWPPIMTTLCEELLGYESVSSKGVYNPIKPIVYSDIDIKNKINNINKQIADGYRLILMIDSDLINDVWDKSSLDLHWVVLESAITWNYEPGFFVSKKDEIDFKVYTWGTNPNGNNRYLQSVITSSHFMNNYNGYIKVK